MANQKGKYSLLAQQHEGDGFSGSTYQQTTPSTTSTTTTTTPHGSMKVTIYRDKTDITSTTPARPHVQKGGGIKNKIIGASRKSLRGLRNKLAMIRDLDQALELGFTYSDEGDFSKYKDHRKNLIERIKYLFEDNVGGIWRLEFKERKSGKYEGCVLPHLHILIPGLLNDLDRLQWLRDRILTNKRYTKMIQHYLARYEEAHGKPCSLNWQTDPLDAFRVWLAAAWYETVGSNDIRHLYTGSHAKWVDHVKQMQFYFAKEEEDFVSQDQDGSTDKATQFSGKRWDTFGNLDCRPYGEQIITAQEYHELVRLLIKCIASRPYPSGKRYADHLQKLNGLGQLKRGFKVLGEGAQSHPDWQKKPQNITIYRMINHARDLVASKEETPQQPADAINQEPGAALRDSLQQKRNQLHLGFEIKWVQTNLRGYLRVRSGDQLNYLHTGSSNPDEPLRNGEDHV